MVSALWQPCEQRLPGSQNKLFRKMYWERQTLEWQASDNRNYLDLESVRPHCSGGWKMGAESKFQGNLNSKYTLWHRGLLVLYGWRGTERGMVCEGCFPVPVWVGRTFAEIWKVVQLLALSVGNGVACLRGELEKRRAGWRDGLVGRCWPSMGTWVRLTEQAWLPECLEPQLPG